MTGHRPFKELTKGFSPERKARMAARAKHLNADMRPLESMATPSDQARGRRERASSITGTNKPPSRAR